MRKIIKQTALTAAAALYLGAVAGIAVNWAGTGRGGMPGAFMSWGAGARSLGMGKAFVSIADDATATYWNPAGLAGITRSELTALHSVLWGGTVYDFISYVQPTRGGGTFGFSGTRLFLGGFEGRDAQNRVTHEFEDIQSAYGVSYGQKILDTLSIGATLKKMSHTLDDHKSGSYIVDMGALYSPVDNLSLGMNLQNLLAVTYGTSDDLPIVARMGLSYRLLRERLTLGMDVQSAIGWEMGTPLHLGAEYWAANFLALRMGIDPQEFNMGFGLRYEDYGLDYAYASHELGGSHRISASITFGRSVEALKQMSSREHEVEGDAAYEAGLYREAVRSYERAYSLNPDNRDLARKLDIISRIADIIPRKVEDTNIGRLIRQGVKEYVEHNNAQVLLLALNHILSEDPEDEVARRLLRLLGSLEGIPEPRIRVPRGVTLTEYKLHEALQYFYDARYSEAIRELQDVLTVDPGNAAAYKRLGSAFFAMGNEERAVEAWEESLRRDPSDDNLRDFLNNIPERQRDFEPEEIMEEMR